uniref:Uncharacterized protein n=1 Tax=Panagrolaimus davidi TaxID=227884 RepID=A0A914PLL8_9BILA
MSLPESSYDQLQHHIPGYHIYLYINCGMITSMYPLCIYLLFIRTDVKLNVAYKYMLFGCATTSFLNSILYCLWAPILTPGFFGGYITGILRYLGTTVNLQLFKIALIVLTNSELCTILLLVFQFSNLRSDSFLSKFGRTSKRLIVSYFCYLGFLIAIALLLVPFSHNENSAFINYANLTSNEFAKDLLANNDIVLTFVAKLNPASYVLASAELISSIFLFVLGLYYTVIVGHVITTTRGVVSHTTYTREKMMLQTFVFKTFMMLIFYAFPMLGYTISLWIGTKSPIFGMIMNIIMVSHGWISYFGTIALIGPYRRIVLSLIFRIPELNVNTFDSSVAPSRTSGNHRGISGGVINSIQISVSS